MQLLLGGAAQEEAAEEPSRPAFSAYGLHTAFAAAAAASFFLLAAMPSPPFPLTASRPAAVKSLFELLFGQRGLPFDFAENRRSHPTRSVRSQW